MNDLSMTFRMCALLSAVLAALAGCAGYVDWVEPASPAPRSTGESELRLSRGDRPHIARQRQLLANGTAGLAPEQIGYYLDIQEARFRQVFANTDIGIERQGQQLTVVLPGAAMFETGSTALSTQVEGPLNTIARVLAEYEKTLVTVAGHTDSTGDSTFNQRLSEQRALSVAEHLAGRGIRPQRLIVVGRGENRPVADNSSAEGRARNRRVNLTLHPIVAGDVEASQ